MTGVQTCALPIFNARMMVAHFDLPEPLPEGGEDGYVRRLNAMTGRDIAVRSVRRVADNAHARFDATSRTYRYFAVTAKSPFLHRLAWQAPYSLDYDAMNAAAAMMLGRRVHRVVVQAVWPSQSHFPHAACQSDFLSDAAFHIFIKSLITALCKILPTLSTAE